MFSNFISYKPCLNELTCEAMARYFLSFNKNNSMGN